jgi:uncharacterized protein YfiM (DUF2279 family)
MKISHDKWMHYALCMTAAAYAGIVAWWVGLLFALAIGAFKEYLDSRDLDNSWCWDDIKADVIGAVAGTLPHLAALL